MKLDYVDEYELFCDEYDCATEHYDEYDDKTEFRRDWWYASEDEFGEYDPDSFEW